MKKKHPYFKILLNLITVLAVVSLPNSAQAQEKVEQTVLAPDDSELLKRGNTWTYAVSLMIPKDVKFTSTLKDKGEKTKAGMIYKFEEIQQSVGLVEIEALKRQAPQINIFIEGKLIKKHILEYRQGSLFYYGTLNHDAEKPDLIKGAISIRPILLYNEKLALADKWSWSADGLPKFQFRTTAKEVEIEVQGKKYIADKILMDQIDEKSQHIFLSKEIWFVKDVGVIKEREKSYVGDGKAVIKTLELKSFANSEIIKN